MILPSGPEILYADYVGLREEVARLTAENAKLAKALEFYADEENYNPAVGYGETEQVIGWLDDGPASSALEKR